VLFKANRLVLGEAHSAFGLDPLIAGVIMGLWLAASLVALAPWRARPWLLAVLASAAAVAALLFVAGAANDLTAGASPSARVSLEGGVWLTLIAAYVVLFGAVSEAPRRLRALMVAPVLAVFTWLAVTGTFSELGLVRELVNVGGDFRAELARHLSLSGTSLLVATLIGVPAAVAASRSPSVARWVLPGAGLVQTLPSLALFGLLVAPLAQLGRSITLGTALLVVLVGALALLTLLRVRPSGRSRGGQAEHGERRTRGARRLLGALFALLPVAPGALLAVLLAVVINGLLASVLGAGSAPAWPAWTEPLSALGVRGIGSAPALIALTLYALLPIVRNTFTGLEAVPRAATEAGRGMGMSPRQLLLRVQLPLALPLIVGGLRAAAVLTIGTTTVAYLIGAGGLGVFIQRGIDQVVPDLVLLGAIPIIVLALLADALLRAVGAALTPRGVREPVAEAQGARQMVAA
jgi:osmoprotectant transport system permease protein